MSWKRRRVNFKRLTKWIENWVRDRLIHIEMSDLWFSTRRGENKLCKITENSNFTGLLYRGMKIKNQFLRAFCLDGPTVWNSLPSPWDQQTSVPVWNFLNLHFNCNCFSVLFSSSVLSRRLLYCHAGRARCTL